jgi:TonB-dependent receptor
MTSASLFATMLYVQPGLAQTAQNDASTTIETVVVTGVKASVQSSLDIKKNSDQMVDSVVAEDIGKLPDNNVIEALQHVTGIQISRNAAEANQLLIRGLPDIATLLNGREIFTSTGRFVTLQDIPAELLQRVDVEKTSRADDIEGGIAGLIDVRLHRPFDFDGFELAGGLRGTNSSLSGHSDPNASLLVSDRWNTDAGEFGLLVDVSYSKDRYKEEIMDNYISANSIGPVPGAVEPAGSGFAPGTAFLPSNQGAQSINGNRERMAADVATQWRPNDSTELYAEVFYTRYRNPNNVDFFVGLPWLNGIPSTATVYPNTNEIKTVTAGGYDLTSDQSFVPKTDTYQAATGGTWKGGNLTLSTELDYTNSAFNQTGYILDTEYYPPTYTADTDLNGTGTPFMNVSGIDMTDPTNFHIRQFYDQWNKQSGNEVDWRGDAAFDMGNSNFIRSIDTGVRYVDRVARNRADNPGGLDCRGDPVADASSPQDPMLVAAFASPACSTLNGAPFTGITLDQLPGHAAHVTSGSQFDGAFGIARWADADPKWLINNINVLRTDFGQADAPPLLDPTQTFDDREQSFAGYAKANFGFDLGTVPVDGNVGLRVVDTWADMSGNQIVVTGVGAPPFANFSFSYVPTSKEKSTVDWLPSLNVRFQLDNDLQLRLGASQTVTHPTFAQLNPGLSLSAQTGTLLGSGAEGNPNLTPEKSDNADLSLEYYFGPQDAITGAVFYRQIDGYFQGSQFSQVIGGISYNISSTANAPSGHIDGFETSYTQFFDMLPGFWSGLGVQTNATYVDGSFQNISKWSYNLVGIYEKGPYSLRVAYNWRSGFNVGPSPAGGQEPGTIFAKSQPWLDLSASYQINERAELTFDATNLLNSSYQDHFGSGIDAYIYPRDTRIFDQTISLGVRFKL